MAIDKNWTRYEVNMGWREVTPTEVFNNSIIIKVLDETIDKDYLNNILDLEGFLSTTLTKNYLNNILDLEGFLSTTLTKNYLNNIMNPSYSKGELKFNE